MDKDSKSEGLIIMIRN